MKKILLVVLLTVLCLSLAGMAYAGGKTITTSQTTVIGGATFRPSTNVSLSVFSEATGYCATSQHASAAGNSAGKQFGTLSTAAIIQTALAETTSTPKPCTASTALPTGPTWQ